MDGPHRKRLFGRRQGHRLSPRRQRQLEEHLPRLGLDPAALSAAPPASLFPVPVDEIHLEIGFGGGEHLAHQAARHPGTGFIGCEPFINGVSSLVDLIVTNRLSNVRLYDDDAADILDALPPASLDRIYLLFPDPWPKKRHNKRRFIGPENIARLARVLKPGGCFIFASDIADYVTWTLRHMRACPDFVWTAEGPGDWQAHPEAAPPTRYEAKTRAAGRIPAWLIYQRIGKSNERAGKGSSFNL